MCDFISTLSLENSIRNTGLETQGTMLITRGTIKEDVSILSGSLIYSQITPGITNLNIIGGSIVINEGTMTVYSGTVKILYQTINPTFPCVATILSGTLNVNNVTTMGTQITFVSGDLSMTINSGIIVNGLINGNTTTDSNIIFSGNTKTHDLTVLGNLNISGSIFGFSFIKGIVANFVNYDIAYNTNQSIPTIETRLSLPTSNNNLNTDGSYGISSLTYESNKSSYMNRTSTLIKINYSGFLTFYSPSQSSGSTSVSAILTDTNGNDIFYTSPYESDPIKLSYTESNYNGMDNLSLPINFNTIIQPNNGFNITHWTNNSDLKILVYSCRITEFN